MGMETENKSMKFQLSALSFQYGKYIGKEKDKLSDLQMRLISKSFPNGNISI